MASRKKHHRNASERLHILLIYCILWMCVLLLLLIMGLQLCNLFQAPAETAETPVVLGSSSLPFRLTTVSIFPFLLLPLLVLIVGALYLQTFFAKHGGSAGESIPFFDKHPGTRTGQYMCNGFAVFAVCVSLLLCILSSVLHTFHGNWLGFPVAAMTAYLLYRSGKLLHSRKRKYLRRKAKRKVPETRP